MKASKSYVVCRDFRGALLFLVSVQRATLSFDWSADGARARRFESAAGAMAAASLARDAYNAACHVRDAAHCLLVPAAAPADSEPRGVARASEFKRVVMAAVAERGPHCAEHTGFTDGCAGCYAVHAERVA